MKTSPFRNVARVLLADRQFDIEFNGYLSNHAKHAIVALERLKASEERVQEYWDDYTSTTPYGLHLHQVDSKWEDVTPASNSQWEAWRGKKVGWQEQVMYMNKELEKLDGNTNKLVQSFAPDVLGGLAGALTHGIIHLGWGIDAESPWMITEGLAYLNFAHLGVDASALIEDAKDDSDPWHSFLRVAETFEEQNLSHKWVQTVKQKYDETFHSELVPAGFQWQLAKVLKEPDKVATELPTWLSHLTIEEAFEKLYRAVTLVYLATRDNDGNGNFVVLHAITSLWALEKTCHAIGVESTTRAALRQYYASLLCLLSTAESGFPSASVLKTASEAFTSDRVDVADMDWSETVKRGIAEEEEHNIKLVYVAKSLWNRYGHWSGYSEAANTFTLTPNIGPARVTFSA